MTYNNLLIHTCIKGTSVSSANSLGEWKLTQSYSGTVECRASPITAAQRVEFIGLYDDVKYTLFLPSGTTLDDGSTWSVFNRVSYEGKYYKINDLRYDSSHHHVTALISELP